MQKYKCIQKIIKNNIMNLNIKYKNAATKHSKVRGKY